MSLFKFAESDTLIFEYSKGERAPDGTFKSVFADPAAIKRQLDICLPNRNALIDQYQSGQAVLANKARDEIAYEADPQGFMTALVIREHGYQATIPDPAAMGAPGAVLPNPETPLQFAKRLNVPMPGALSPEEIAIVKMGGIGHQNLCLGIRAAFDLLNFDETTGSGCTDHMAIAVMNHYFDWLSKKNGSTPETPTSSPPSPAA